MALVLNDRVRETTTTTGTGAVALGGAVSGFETFAAGIGNSNTVYYAIVHRTAAEFEVGLGTLDGDSSDLTRTTVISSSNSDSAVDFASGTKDVFCTLPASKAVFEDASGNVTLPADLSVGDDLTINGGVVEVKNTGSQSVVRFYCESSNAHYAQIQAPAHSDFSGNTTLTLPAVTDTLVGLAATQTLTNKTLTTPTITSPAITGASTITVTDNSDTLTLKSTDTDANIGPNLRLYRAVTGAASDAIGTIDWAAQDATGGLTDYASAQVTITDASDGSEDGTLTFKVMNAGSLNQMLTISGPETVINEGSKDHDFRVETNGQTHAIFAEGGTDRVGIFNSSPSVALDVTGDFKVSGSITIGSTAITSTAAELNFSDGVTSNIQTQLDTKTTAGFAVAMAIAL